LLFGKKWLYGLTDDEKRLRFEKTLKTRNTKERT